MHDNEDAFCHFKQKNVKSIILDTSIHIQMHSASTDVVERRSSTKLVLSECIFMNNLNIIFFSGIMGLPLSDMICLTFYEKQHCSRTETSALSIQN